MTAWSLGLQIFHVFFLALHDWIPLGRLNDIRAVRAENPGSKLLLSTVISTVPYAIILALSLRHGAGPLPHGLWIAQLCAYGLLLIGEIQAWWWPYFFGTSQATVERYRKMFGNTAAFLPTRNSIQPNTLHVILHAATVALVALSARAVFFSN